jgi:hypothetical protein
VDNRPAAVAQRQLIEMSNNSPRVFQQRALSDAIHNSPRMVAQRHEMHALFGGAVRQQGNGAISASLSPARRKEKPNNTGMPNQLKSGIESLSGMRMDHVKVHYNSAEPAQLQAHAYAQSSEIHLGAGQERHLPHEAWLVVQQAQGRVWPTLQMKAGAVNDDPSLEREADMMGGKAAQFRGVPATKPLAAEERTAGVVNHRFIRTRFGTTGAPIQRYVAFKDIKPYLKNMSYGQRQNVFRWNVMNKFDNALAPNTLAQQINDWKDISTGAVHGSLAPGQRTAAQELPAWMENTTPFTVSLPEPEWGALRFVPGFHRRTAKGWISDSVELPPAVFNDKQRLSVHVILALSEEEGKYAINPHVTVRVTEYQDHADQISMINDNATATKESDALGRGASDHSLSVGLANDRDKQARGAEAHVGLTLAAVKEKFKVSWLEDVGEQAARQIPNAVAKKVSRADASSSSDAVPAAAAVEK